MSTLSMNPAGKGISDQDRFFQFGRFDGERARRFTRGFWMLVAIYVVICLSVIKSTDLLDLTASVILSIVCLLPGYLWARGSALGLPLWPVFSFVHMPSFVFPLLTNHTMTQSYLAEERFAAALWIAGAIGAGTIVWFFIVSKSRKPPRFVFMVPQSGTNQGSTDILLVLAFVMSAGFKIGLNHNYFGFLINALPFGGFSLIRGVASAVAIITTFLCFERIGSRGFSVPLRVLFLSVFAFAVLDEAAGLILAGAFSMTIPALLGYTFGSRKIPVMASVIVVAAFAFLNQGKHSMRAERWGEHNVIIGRVGLASYPSHFSKWTGASINNIFSPEEDPYYDVMTAEVASASLVDRVSMMHIFLLTFTQTPEYIPALEGRTYRVIPSLLIPRIINPDKPMSHIGQSILNVHYGLQTEDGTRKTFIAWGLLPEAHANFGAVGMVAFSIAFALFLSVLTMMSMNVPLFSLRVLVSSIVMFQLFDVENVMTLFVTTTYQILIILFALAIATMRLVRNPMYDAILQENSDAPSEVTETEALPEVAPEKNAVTQS